MTKRTVHDSYEAHENCAVAFHNGVVEVDLYYPNVEDNQLRTVQINQDSVRASDGIRVTYDYARDGWSIQQPLGEDDDWAETAFVQSWAREPD